MYSNVYRFGLKPARSPRQKTPLKELYDYRSGIRVLACDETYDIAEPHASELEGLMSRRRIGFGHLWRLTDISTGLQAELTRVGVPLHLVNGVVVAPRDFRVVDELPPTESSMAMAELEAA